MRGRNGYRKKRREAWMWIKIEVQETNFSRDCIPDNSLASKHLPLILSKETARSWCQFTLLSLSFLSCSVSREEVVDNVDMDSGVDNKQNTSSRHKWKGRSESGKKTEMDVKRMERIFLLRSPFALNRSWHLFLPKAFVWQQSTRLINFNGWTYT